MCKARTYDFAGKGSLHAGWLRFLLRKGFQKLFGRINVTVLQARHSNKPNTVGPKNKDFTHEAK